MANTYLKIASVTVTGATAANIEFTSIPATYDDLLLKLSTRTDRSSATDGLNLVFNGNNTTYTYRYLLGDGSSASSANGTATVFAQTTGNTATASTFGSLEIYIPSYAGATNKAFSTDSVSENNATAANAWLGANLWSNTAAITSIRITSQLGTNLLQHSTAVLYGTKRT